MAIRFTVSRDQMLAVAPDGTRLSAVPSWDEYCGGCFFFRAAGRGCLNDNSCKTMSCSRSSREDRRYMHWKRCP